MLRLLLFGVGICFSGLLCWLENLHLDIFFRQVKLHLSFINFFEVICLCKSNKIWCWDFSICEQVRPLVKPTRTIVDMNNIRYSWHDFVSRSKWNCAWFSHFMSYSSKWIVSNASLCLLMVSSYLLFKKYLKWSQ